MYHWIIKECLWIVKFDILLLHYEEMMLLKIWTPSLFFIMWNETAMVYTLEEYWNFLNCKIILGSTWINLEPFFSELYFIEICYLQ